MVPTQVGPGKEERIAVRVDAGAEACWSALLIRVSDGGGRGGTFIAKLYAIPTGATPEADVVGLSVTPAEMSVEIRNGGDLPIRLQQSRGFSFRHLSRPALISDFELGAG